MISYDLDDSRSPLPEEAPEPAHAASPGDHFDHMSSRDYRRLAGILENLVGRQADDGRDAVAQARP